VRFALETLKTAHEFLARLNMDNVEMEWLVTNWCKIKRNLWKAVHQKTTIADYVNIRESLIEKDFNSGD